jgi:23S rRNA (guanosine2251-2'-O)-methyltransferase
MLDHLEDPHNLGAIIRTCEAAGVKTVIIPKDRQVPINSTVMKTSVGTLDNVKIVQVSNLVNAIGQLKEHGYWVVGTSLENSQDYRSVDYTGKIVLIIGNENNGISKLVSDNCDYLVKIPMYGTTNSLNASVAAGIMIYEVIRNRK